MSREYARRQMTTNMRDAKVIMDKDVPDLKRESMTKLPEKFTATDPETGEKWELNHVDGGLFGKHYLKAKGSRLSLSRYIEPAFVRALIQYGRDLERASKTCDHCGCQDCGIACGGGDGS